MDNQQFVKENKNLTIPQKNAALHNLSDYYQKAWRKISKEINGRDRKKRKIIGEIFMKTEIRII